MPRDQDPPQTDVSDGERSIGSASWQDAAQELLSLFHALPADQQDQALHRLRRRVQRQVGRAADVAAAERNRAVSPLQLVWGDFAEHDAGEGEDAADEDHAREPAPLRQTPQLERLARLGALIQRGQLGRRQKPVQTPHTACHAQDMYQDERQDERQDMRDEHDTSADLARDDHQAPVERHEERHEELAAEERPTPADTAQVTLYEDWLKVKQLVETVVHQQQQAEQPWERLASALTLAHTVMSPLSPLSLDALQTLGRQGWELRQQEGALWREVADTMAAQHRQGLREPDGEQNGDLSGVATAEHAEGAGSALGAAGMKARSTPDRYGHAPAGGEAGGDILRDLVGPHRPLSLPPMLEACRRHLERARQDQQATRQRLAPEDRWYVIMWEEAGEAYGAAPVSGELDREARATRPPTRSAQAHTARPPFPPASANAPQHAQTSPVASVARAPQILALYDYPAPWSGVIVPGPTGIAFEQQTCGLLCHHERLEGTLLPLARPMLGADLMALDAGCCGPLSWEEAVQIDLVLVEQNVPLEVAYDQLDQSTEAWIWVRISERAENSYALFPFRGSLAVLTFENCD